MDRSTIRFLVWFLYFWGLPKDFFTIGVCQRIPLLLGSDKGFLYYWDLTKDSFTIGVCHWGLTKDSFTIGVWQRIPLLLGSDKQILYYWGLTNKFFTIGVWQRIPLLLRSEVWQRKVQGFSPKVTALFWHTLWRVRGRLNLAPGQFIIYWAVPADLQTHFKQQNKIMDLIRNVPLSAPGWHVSWYVQLISIVLICLCFLMAVICLAPRS